MNIFHVLPSFIPIGLSSLAEPTTPMKIYILLLSSISYCLYCNFIQAEELFPYQIVGTDQNKSLPQPRYQDNADGTVSDLNTGLMWVQARGIKLPFDELPAAARECNVGNYTDWRVPTIKELYSLIRFSGTNGRGFEGSRGYKPFIEDGIFDFVYGDESRGERIIDAQDWSSTPDTASTQTGRPRIFGVNFTDGRIKAYPRFSPKTPGESHRMYVRFVRGNPAYGKNQFVEKGGIIADQATGLLWSKADSGKALSYPEAEKYVQMANARKYLGASDWRLPTAKELHSIVDYTRSPDVTGTAALAPCFNITSIVNEGGQKDFPSFWSSSHLTTGPGRGDPVYIAFGRALGFMRGGWRDVHGAGAQRSDPAEANPAKFPEGRGPQGDVVRAGHFVRLVRSAPTRPAPSANQEQQVTAELEGVIQGSFL